MRVEISGESVDGVRVGARAGVARVALGVLTERVRQEEDGWPDQAGDGKRTAHGTGNSHACLLETKHNVENALYAIGTPELRRLAAAKQTFALAWA